MAWQGSVRQLVDPAQAPPALPHTVFEHQPFSGQVQQCQSHLWTALHQAGWGAVVDARLPSPGMLHSRWLQRTGGITSDQQRQLQLLHQQRGASPLPPPAGGKPTTGTGLGHWLAGTPSLACCLDVGLRPGGGCLPGYPDAWRLTVPSTLKVSGPSRDCMAAAPEEAQCLSVATNSMRVHYDA